MAADAQEMIQAGSPIPALLQFIHRLRAAGIPVSMVEAVDAARALEHLDLSRRDELKAALVATLVKGAEHLADFSALFDAFFSRMQGPALTTKALLADDSGAEVEAFDESPSATGMPSDEMLQNILKALKSNDLDALRFLAMAAASQFGGLKAGDARSERYYMYRILRQLDLSALLQRAIVDEREEDASELDARLSREEQLARVEEFRRLIAEAIRQRLASIAGLQQAGDSAAPGAIEDVDFLGASAEQQRQMREAIQPLARKLAARIAHRQHRRRHGRLDARRTVRHSLSTGGVPLDPVFRRPKVARPELVMLCDVSGSVAEFAEFTLSLLNVMNDEFSRIRSFAFIDGIDEVTEMFASGNSFSPRQLLWRRQLVWADGHSDYDHVFETFWDKFGRGCITPKTTLIITGDARNNFKGQSVEALKQIAGQARKVYWLNPESKSEWNEGDSIIDRYAPWCDGVFETRNLRQLTEFVYRLNA